MFKKLMAGIGLSRGSAGRLSDSERRSYEEKKQERDLWRHDVDQLLAVRSCLAESYGRHKGDFALGRYEELKRMTKTAIADCDVIVREQRERPPIGDRYTESISKRTAGAIALKNKAHGLCEKENVKMDAVEMNADELDAEIARMRKEILQLKQDFRKERDACKKLEVNYECSKNVNPAQRYMDIKELIKTYLAS